MNADRAGAYPSEAAGFFRDASDPLPEPAAERRSPAIPPEKPVDRYEGEDAGIPEADSPSAPERSPRAAADRDAGTAPAPVTDAAGSAGGADSSAGDVGAAVNPASCPESTGRIWNDNGHCYFPLNVAYSWNVSRDECRELDAELASITSAEEQAFVGTLMSDMPRWIGLARFGAPAFSWIDGEGVVYENWEMGEPSVGGDAAALLRPGTSQWFAEPVGAMYLALCERQP